jgi:hypothetical protein
MADPAADDVGVDLEQLTPNQREALQQYTQVTDQDIKDAVPLLQRSQWNVQVSNESFHVVGCQLGGGAPSTRTYAD